MSALSLLLNRGYIGDMAWRVARQINAGANVERHAWIARCLWCGEIELFSLYHDRGGLQVPKYCADAMCSLGRYNDKRKKEAPARVARALRLREQRRYRIIGAKTYLIRQGTSDFYKIGRAMNPDKRLSALQGGNPVKLEIVAVLDADVERVLHKALARHQEIGEWYTLTPEKVRAIISLYGMNTT